MNPSGPKSIPWINPPPPGTEQESPELPDDLNRSSDERNDAEHQERPIDRIDPYLKNPVYRGREEQFRIDRLKYKTRSITPEYRHRRRHSRHSRSKSKEKKSHSRRHKRYSSSRSNSRGRSGSLSRSHSRSPTYSHKHKKHSRRYSSRSKSRSLSYSRSRSRSRSRSHFSSSRHHHHHHHHHHRHHRSPPTSNYRRGDYHRHHSRIDLERIEIEENAHNFEQQQIDQQHSKESSPIREVEEEEEEQPAVPFKNDGTFLEMFKKLQEEKQQQQQQPSKQLDEIKPILPAFGKRRGGKVLKTGRVQKVKNAPDDGSCSNSNSQDAWSVYMNEVRKYKEACCDDDSKTRPLMK